MLGGGASAGGVVGGPGLVLQMNRSKSAPETLSTEILRPAASEREGEGPEAGAYYNTLTPPWFRVVGVP